MYTKESWAMAEGSSSDKQGMKDRPMAATRKLTRLVAYGLMVLLGISTLELASYSYLRMVEGYDGEHLMTYEFYEYKNIKPTPNYHNTNGIHHNAQGFREDSDTSREKDANTYRIFIMGGSTAYGLQSMSRFGQDKYSIIRNNETIDAYLEEYLRGKAGNKKVEVINAAITSQY